MTVDAAQLFCAEEVMKEEGNGQQRGASRGCSTASGMSGCSGVGGGVHCAMGGGGRGAHMGRRLLRYAVRLEVLACVLGNAGLGRA